MKPDPHHSSVQVMFSDKGSTFLGVFSVILMVTLSLTLFILKFQKKPILLQGEKKVHNHFFTKKTFKHSRILFYPLHPKPVLLFHDPVALTSKKVKNTPPLDNNP